MTTLVYDWSTGGGTGWGTYGKALATYAPALGVRVLTVGPVEDDTPVERVTVDRIPPDAIVLTGMGDDAITTRHGFPVPAPSPAKRVGVIFSEQTNWSDIGKARLGQYDLIVAGSTWNGAVVAAQTDRPVHVVFQGVDPTLFRDRRVASMAIRRELGLMGKVAVFSGGKLEYRKGQDIALAAFAMFRAVVPNAVLVTAWHNTWPATMRTLPAGGYVHSLPPASTGPALTEWLTRHGIPADAHVDAGQLTHEAAADWLTACDLAVFPNRAEGGTNLVAMEAAACGLPMVLTHGHGHADLSPAIMGVTLAGVPCAAPHLPPAAVQGWRDTAAEAVVHGMLTVLDGQDRQRPTPVWDWATQIQRLVETVTR